MTLDDLFTLGTLTAAINRLPFQPSLIGSMNLFTESGVTTPFVLIEERQGKLVLVPMKDRNDAPNVSRTGKRRRRTFEVPHIPTTDVLLPDALAGVAAFGQQDVPAAQAAIINDRLQAMKNNLDVTREFHRMGAINGLILDADGTSVIYDLYAEFGMNRKSIQIDFSSPTTDVRKQCLDAKRASEKALGVAMGMGFKAVCDSDFFDALTGHESVKAAFANWQAAQDRLGGDNRAGFTFGGIEYIEYNASIGNVPFVPKGTARVFPTGAGIFKMYNSPANYNETVNTLGIPMYAKSEPRKMGKGWDLEAQANPLAMNTSPDAVIELKVK